MASLRTTTRIELALAFFALLAATPGAAQDAGDAYNRGLVAYDHGDYANALREWVQLAEERGDPRAQYNLGVMYHEGQGVPRDETQAANWFKQAADQGNTAAKHSLDAVRNAR